jgi:hypothetical protein
MKFRAVAGIDDPGPDDDHLASSSLRRRRHRCRLQHLMSASHLLMPAHYERPSCVPSLVRFIFQYALAAAVARTDCSSVSAGAHNRHCRRHNSNPRNRANGEFENALDGIQGKRTGNGRQ